MTLTGIARTLGAAALAASLLAACGPPAARGAAPDAGYRADYDPIERVNRKVFWLNDKVDVYVLAPVATGWDTVAPDRVQTAVANFFTNLRFPIVLLNDVLQGKPRDSVSDVARFALNTVYGLAGLFDPATGWGLPQHSEDFGQTLGWWGVPPGPYLVLPLLGPSNPRDTVGLAGDAAASVTPFFVGQYILLGARVIETVNTRALVLEQVRQAKQASFDYYTFVRNAYFQRRAALVNDRVGTAGESDESLYHTDSNGKE